MHLSTSSHAVSTFSSMHIDVKKNSISIETKWEETKPDKQALIHIVGKQHPPIRLEAIEELTTAVISYLKAPTLVKLSEEGIRSILQAGLQRAIVFSNNLIIGDKRAALTSLIQSGEITFDSDNKKMVIRPAQEE